MPYNIGPGICFATFIKVKNHKIANNSATAEAREKISTDFESSEFLFKHVLLTLNSHWPVVQ
jgi:hypothetical protein